jgi:hypothetical protein
VAWPSQQGNPGLNVVKRSPTRLARYAGRTRDGACQRSYNVEVVSAGRAADSAPASQPAGQAFDSNLANPNRT